MENEGEDQKVDAATVSDIEGAVNQTIDTIEKERAASKPDPEKNLKDETPSGKDQSGDDKGGKAPDGEKGKDGEGEGNPPEVADALVERAVKAGMSISDARSFQTAEALERMCGMLETRKPGAEAGAGKGEEEGKPEDDPLDAIPDLDPEKYDENVVAGFKAMKDIIRKQQTALNAGSKTGEMTWFDSQVAALGESFAEALGAGETSKLDPNSSEAGTRAQLKEKMDVLLAGYKAAGKEVSKDVAFKEAVSVVLGDVQSKSEAALKSKDLADRRRKHIARPSGAKVTPTADPLSEVADIVNTKYFGKK
jgi:hypothetical protein